MCGIVGYIGKNDASEALIHGLKKLEYRGYDSCGIAILSSGILNIYKTVSRIDGLRSLMDNSNTSHIGIGHTRWATHGGVTEINAHPHFDCNKKFVVVHNGIIENYLEIKKSLEKEGFNFYSETDTEVIPNLISMNYEGDLLKAVKKSTDMLEGSFALVVMDVADDSTLIATKRNSPLIVGYGNQENFIASDFSAILKYTNKISVFENNEIAVIKKDDIKFFDNDLNPQKKMIKTIEMEDSDTEKNGYHHYMLKEIHENSVTVKKILNNYVKNGNIEFDLHISEEDLKKIKCIHIVACGTAMHAGLIAKKSIEKLTRIPVIVEVASEFRYSNPILSKDDLAIFISQSGETADTIASLELVRNFGMNYISVVNVRESTIDHLSENVLYTLAGSEVAVASTKAYIAQVMVLNLFAFYLAKKLKTYNSDELDVMLKEANELPNKIQIVLEKDELYNEFAKKHYEMHDMFYLGREIDYYVSLEGSLKLKEISYIHSEAMPFGELKHGPIALIEKGTPAIVIATDEGLIEKTISNIKEIKARGANVLVFTTSSNFPENVADEVIILPYVRDIFSPIVSTIPLQLIAYHITVLKNLDVDKPRNLAKSVTVE